MTESLRVFKFGGSSLGSPERLLRVVEIVRRERAASPLAVVVSAMGDSTDLLIQAVERAACGDEDGARAALDEAVDGATSTVLVAASRLGLEARVAPLVRAHFAPLQQLLQAVALLRHGSAQSLDLVLSFGEILSARVLAALLEGSGTPAVFVDSRDWTVTDEQFGAAVVDAEASRARLGALRPSWGEALPVTTGFLGRTRDGRSTTLGRNGSDYTATLLGWALAAAEVVAWTDVPGVMTADPTIVREAYPLRRMSYLEALELANFGARMFHPRTMVPLIAAGIPMRIRSTMSPTEEGTVIDAHGDEDRSRPTSVTSLENLALVSVQWRSLTRPADAAERALRALAEAGVTVWMGNQAAHGQSLGVVVPVAQVARAEAALTSELALELSLGEVEPVSVRQPVTLLTLVAEAMGQSAGVAGRFFHSLGGVGVNVLASVQGASSRSVSCAIAAEDTQVAVRTVHAAFNLAHQQVSLLVLGKGSVGQELIRQIREQREVLRRDHDRLLEVVGVADSRRELFDPAGLALEDWQGALAAQAPSEEPWFPRYVRLLEALRRLPVPVLVDCTGADGMEALYREAFRRGVHVVAANKKPLTIPWAERQALLQEARRCHREYRYETTVGASLPVVETLKDLVRTGDRVRLVEGSFSGTLGYLSNELMAGVPLSQAVRTARELGYTEPNPQDDLSGLDAARKALILARELGYDLAIEQVEVAPLVPPALLAPMALEDFFAALAAHEAAFAAELSAHAARGETLRYLARVDPPTDTEPARLRVGPVYVPPAHPATRLRGTESFVAFTTERYSEYPLLVQGPGAGGPVTAAGVLADILRVGQSLRGR